MRNGMWQASKSLFIKDMEILYDGETIILLGKSKYINEHFISNIWYYHFNKDGNMEIIMNAKQILKGFSNAEVFKPLPEIIENNGTVKD